MRRWLVGTAMAWGFTAVVCQAQQDTPAVAPAPIQVQFQIAPAGQAAPVQIQNIQIAPAQIQIAQPAIARADVAIMPGYVGGMSRFTASDAIVVGRVIAFEPMDVEASPAANQPKSNYRIAVVQVTDAIYGVKKETQTIRVGFIAPANGGPNGGGIGGGAGGVQILPAVQPGGIQIQPGFGRRPYIGSVQLQMGQDGIFTLNKHHKENFYIAPNFNSFVNRQNNGNFDNEVKTAKQLAKVIGNPVAALKADDNNERVLAAAILLNKYRNPANTTGAPMKQEPIDAEESKLILKALGQGDWTVGRSNGATPNAFEMFNQLGVNQKDGYNPTNVRNQQDIVKAMQTWLTANTDKYRIQRFVVDPNAKPGLNPMDLPANPAPGGLIRPGVRPIRPAVPIQIRPINGKVQILPVPVPAPDAPAPDAPPQVDPAPAPAPQLLPLRRE